MSGKNRTPKYAVRLVAIIVIGGTVFFGGLRFFVPEGSKLTGSYDAKSLLYIADAPVSYAGSKSCGTENCHAPVFKEWSEGAHGAKKVQSKCEVCHGPKGGHPGEANKIQKVRGDGDIVELCLVCHRKMKARSTTGQPQISPQEHPYPHEGVLTCTKCHNPHSPGLKSPISVSEAGAGDKAKTDAVEIPPVAEGCTSCHGPLGRGGFAPVLAGQTVEALKDKLIKFKSGELTNPMMNPVASKLSDKEIDALANYFEKI